MKLFPSLSLSVVEKHSSFIGVGFSEIAETQKSPVEHQTCEKRKLSLNREDIKLCSKALPLDLSLPLFFLPAKSGLLRSQTHV